ncbi:hypothetical protein [Streptomyces sp. Y1]|uniref:Uncharacterized protein n=1 Tax=Streptomyces sp. Y1 TaxID=3238634 RepID=A0AB39TEY7_9ACTN
MTVRELWGEVSGALGAAVVRGGRPRAGRWVLLAGRGAGAGVGGPRPGGAGGVPAGGAPPGGCAGGSGARGRRDGRARGAPPPQPVAVALAVEAADFAGLARYGLFGALRHQEYLRRSEEQLRALHGQGVEVHLRVFEAGDFEDYCDALGLDPRTPAARVAYAGDPELAGEPFVYTGERLADLAPVLLDDHRARVRMSVACAALLDAVGDDPAGQRRLTSVMRYVTSAYLALAEGAGEGCHLLTLRCHGPEDGEELTSAADVCVEAGSLRPAGRDTEAFCVTLAAGVAAGGAGAVLLHGDPETGPVVRGWALAGGRLRPMTVHEVFDELADDAERGLPFPPGVMPRPGFPLPDVPPAGPSSSGPPPSAPPPSGRPSSGPSRPGFPGPRKGGGPLG